MLLLLPPSEGKTAPRRGRALALDDLSFPALTTTRDAILDAVVSLAHSDPDHARAVLGLSAGQLDEIERNGGLRTAPTARADRVYSGVLYEALDFETLPPPARRRATANVLVFSALFGVVRLGDRIPAYRLSGGTTLPGLGSIASRWRAVLPDVLASAAGRGLIVDLRSSTYAAMWRPPAESAGRTVTVRVLHEAPDGTRSVVSHFNKATKGRLVRSLLIDGAAPRTADDFAGACERLGYRAEPAPGGGGSPSRLDIVVSEV